MAIVFLEDGAVASVSTLETGTEDYCRKDGETFPACGDLRRRRPRRDRGRLRPSDGGPRPALRRSEHGLRAARQRPLGCTRLLRVPTPQKFKGELHPAVGDVDGDGRDELVVGMGKTRFGHLVVLDDAGADFGLHMGNRTGEPWLTLDIGLRSARGRYETFPALGDLDGDGRDEIVVSFTRGSGARVALLDDAVDGFPATPTSLYTLQTGRDRYARKNGETRAAIADLDGDGMDEIVVGFSKRAANEVQVFDDVMQALRPMHTADGFVTSPDPNVEIVPAPTR
ncbi:MAG: VCBS repeat-containing protein [Myxococcota bacterium]